MTLYPYENPVFHRPVVPTGDGLEGLSGRQFDRDDADVVGRLSERHEILLNRLE